MQEKHIVVVHYNEDRNIVINKIKEKKYPHTIYHKGNNPQPGDIKLPNYGTGDWVVFKHIVDNYDNLPEYLVYVQANPDDHVHEFMLAVESTFTSGYGSFCYARSIYDQYRTGCEVLHPIQQLSHLIGVGFDNDLNSSKFIYNCCPGTIFYVHRDRVRQRPKEFYENIINLELDDELLCYNLSTETDYPLFFYNSINLNYKNAKGLDFKRKLLKLSKPVSPAQYIYAAAIEPLYYHIFADIELQKKLNHSQLVLGNKLYFDTRNETYTGEEFEIYPYSKNTSKTILNFKLLENDWFDWNCPNYLKWREKLIEKTIWEGEQRGFDGRQLLEFYERVGYKHISL